MINVLCCAFVAAFGLTEASPGTHCPTDEDVKHHTVGVALQNTQFKVACNAHAPVASRQGGGRG